MKLFFTIFGAIIAAAAVIFIFISCRNDQVVAQKAALESATRFRDAIELVKTLRANIDSRLEITSSEYNMASVAVSTAEIYLWRIAKMSSDDLKTYQEFVEGSEVILAEAKRINVGDHSWDFHQRSIESLKKRLAEKQ